MGGKLDFVFLIWQFGVGGSLHAWGEGIGHWRTICGWAAFWFSMKLRFNVSMRNASFITMFVWWKGKEGGDSGSGSQNSVGNTWEAHMNDMDVF